MPDMNHRLQAHSSLIRRLALENVLEGHNGCVNAIAWNSDGSLLLSGSDDTRVNIWSYNERKLIHSIDTGHSANIFCAKFVPETSNEIVVSGAGDSEVRLFHLSRITGRGSDDNAAEPSAIFNCHSKRVKKLAVEVGNPHVVWSASEDGTLRQHDFREGTSCPPVGSSNQECRNVLLDFRSASKKSLADSPKQCLALKSCDISTTRPHQLLVGGSDAFGRLYDRRMLPPLSSSQSRLGAPKCVSYFCPMHLSERRRTNLHLTHVTFSPSGEELLLSYSGEHVYLMDVNNGNQDIVKYSASDVSKQMDFATKIDEAVSSHLGDFSGNHNIGKASRRRLDMCKNLIQVAAKVLEDGSNYTCGIEACSEVLDGKDIEIGSALKHECLCIRAALFLKRRWKNDVHMAIRDCNKAYKLNPSSFKAYYHMSEALTQLGRHKEALNYALRAQLLSPADTEVSDKVDSIKEHLAAAERKNKESEGSSKTEAQPRRLRSLTDMLFRSDANSDASQDRSERDESDYEDEMELDFETSISGDEGNDTDSRILRGSLNLRFHRREETTKENGSVNGSCGSPSSSQNEKTTHQAEIAIDMKQRYVGHCNVGTDIKQASFLGQHGEFVASGSDDGRWFIWEKRTGRLIKVLLGDEAVVNCVQCHPFDCTVATSGIDSTIKIWTAHAQAPSIVAGGATGPETADVLSIMENNQHKLSRSRETIVPFEFFERFRMHEFAEGTFHPFECAQS